MERPATDEAGLNQGEVDDFEYWEDEDRIIDLPTAGNFELGGEGIPAYTDIFIDPNIPKN